MQSILRVRLCECPFKLTSRPRAGSCDGIHFYVFASGGRRSGPPASCAVLIKVVSMMDLSKFCARSRFSGSLTKSSLLRVISGDLDVGRRNWSVRLSGEFGMSRSVAESWRNIFLMQLLGMLSMDMSSFNNCKAYFFSFSVCSAHCIKIALLAM